MINDLQSTFKLQFYSVINKNYKILHMELNKQADSHCHMDIFYQLSVISTNNNNSNNDE